MVTKTFSEDFQKEPFLEQVILERKVLRTLFYYAGTIPAKEDQALAVLISAVVEYLDSSTEIIIQDGYSLAFRAWNYYHQKSRRVKKQLQADVRKAIEGLIDISSSSGPRFYTEFKLIMFNAKWLGGSLYGKTFELSDNQILNIKTEIIPTLPEDAVEELKSIGELMKRYIN